MEGLFDPSVLIGLVTLVVLEIVLGIDNLLFITILAEKLPRNQQNTARLSGLFIAMALRLVMLLLLSWMVTLKRPLFSVWEFSFSGRDLILMVGGLFLLAKSTMELHERLEGVHAENNASSGMAGFWVVVTQIVVLDTVFSIDAVVTAVGMVSQLWVMMLAIVISVVVMAWAQKPIAEFIGRHPTVVVLCLSFLLIIGLSLIVESFGYEIPKGYMYAAIGFSIMIEMFNQIARANFAKSMAKIPLRNRTADAVLALLGGAKSRNTPAGQAVEPVAGDQPPVFGKQEREMVSGVLSLGERTVQSIMTPRNEIFWIDLSESKKNIRNALNEHHHSYFPVADGHLDNLAGIARAKDVVDDLHRHGHIMPDSIRPATVLHESAGILQAMTLFKTSRSQIAVVVDEFGSVEGVVTTLDILEAIAGEFPDEDETLSVKKSGENVFDIDGAADLYTAEQATGLSGLVKAAKGYSTVSGFMLDKFAAIPNEGESFTWHGYRFEVLRMTDRRIDTVRVTKLDGKS